MANIAGAWMQITLYEFKSYIAKFPEELRCTLKLRQGNESIEQMDTQGNKYEGETRVFIYFRVY